MLRKKLGRRQFLTLSAAGAAGLVLGACAPQVATPAPTEGAGAPEPEATQPPAEEQPAQPTNTAAAPAPVEEGTAKYKESPQLAQLVEAGSLPPVDERLPLEPRILPTVDGTGTYSDTLNLLSLGTFGDFGHELFQGSFGENNDSSIFADFCSGYEVSDDATTYTIHIRKGLKWSDGTPVTTEDVRFWYEDDATYTEISPSTPGFGYTMGTEFCKLEIVDDFTYKLSWSKPNPTFPYTLRYWASMWWCSPTGTPSHYMKQFHKKYNDQIEAEATQEEFDTWVAYYGARKSPTNARYGNQKPALCSWLMKESTQTHQTYGPNPYYWGVDQDGNQLPYFNEVLEVLVTDQESYNLKVVAGEADYAAFNTKLKDMPVFVDGADAAGYEVRRYKSPRGSDESFSFNYTYKDPALAEIFQDPRWTQAMSFAVNRAEIQDVVFLGTGVPRQAAPNPEVSFFKKEWEDHCAQYDPDQANALLDEMGLNEKDADGFRLRKDGQPLEILIEYTTNIDSPAVDVIALVAQHWEAVGVNVEYKEIERELLFTRGQTNELMVGVWHTDRTNEARIYVPASGKIVADSIAGENPSTNEWFRWHNTAGAEGIEPPDDWKQHFADIDAWHSTTSEDEYKRLATKIFDFVILEKLRVIGTVGYSAWPVIVKNGIKNLPADGYMGDDTGFARSLFSATWFREA
jgi:peptide/nickel transport system substrate-binding protein